MKNFIRYLILDLNFNKTLFAVILCGICFIGPYSISLFDTTVFILIGLCLDVFSCYFSYRILCEDIAPLLRERGFKTNFTLDKTSNETPFSYSFTSTYFWAHKSRGYLHLNFQLAIFLRTDEQARNVIPLIEKIKIASVAINDMDIKKNRILICIPIFEQQMSETLSISDSLNAEKIHALVEQICRKLPSKDFIKDYPRHTDFPFELRTFFLFKFSLWLK